MTPTTRPAQAAHQLTKLLDHPNPDTHQQLAARLTTLALTIHTVGHLAQQRAHDQAPGIRAANTDPRGSGLGDPTSTAALHNLGATDDDTVDLEHQLRTALTELDNAARRLTHLVTQAVTVHRNNPTTPECSEALCTDEATPGRLGYCETDYRRRLRWAEANTDTTPPDWDSATHQTPVTLTKAERLGIHQAPALTHEQLADRSIRKRRKPA